MLGVQGTLQNEPECRDKQWPCPETGQLPEISSEVMCDQGLPHCCSQAGHKGHSKKKKKERKEKKKDYQHLFLNPFHHGYLSWYKANGQDDRSVQELVHLFHACLVCSPWGYEEPEKSSLCAGEAPSSKLYPRALQCKVPGATEKEGTDAGGTRVGSDKGSVKQIMMGKSMGRGV